jgi:hypothetical protein
MKSKVHLVSLRSNIVEDNYKKGEGKATGCGLDDERIGQTFDSFQQMLDYLSVNYRLSRKVSDYSTPTQSAVTLDMRISTSIMVVDHSNEQNGGWMEPTKEEKKL